MRTKMHDKLLLTLYHSRRLSPVTCVRKWEYRYARCRGCHFSLSMRHSPLFILFSRVNFKVHSRNRCCAPRARARAWFLFSFIVVVRCLVYVTVGCLCELLYVIFNIIYMPIFSSKADVMSSMRYCFLKVDSLYLSEPSYHLIDL